MATYVVGDIHNEYEKFCNILKQIRLKGDDTLYLLGDVFDRGGEDANPADTYFELLKLKEQCIWIRGNHDHWLADYIYRYYITKESKRWKLLPYTYNSFALLAERLTDIDMLNLADHIMTLPLQCELRIGNTCYLLAHALTSSPDLPKERNAYYMMADREPEDFITTGIRGYISLLGHQLTNNLLSCKDGHYLDAKGKSIWVNDKENVYYLDCGCGFADGYLACLCLETGERFYA